MSQARFGLRVYTALALVGSTTGCIDVNCYPYGYLDFSQNSDVRILDLYDPNKHRWVYSAQAFPSRYRIVRNDHSIEIRYYQGSGHPTVDIWIENGKGERILFDVTGGDTCFGPTSNMTGEEKSRSLEWERNKPPCQDFYFVKFWSLENADSRTEIATLRADLVPNGTICGLDGP